MKYTTCYTTKQKTKKIRKQYKISKSQYIIRVKKKKKINLYHLKQLKKKKKKKKKKFGKKKKNKKKKIK